MNEKYLQTARLGEGVIYVLPELSPDLSGRRFHAALIIKQTTETNVDLFVFYADGHSGTVRSVDFDAMAERPGSWSNRPKI